MKSTSSIRWREVRIEVRTERNWLQTGLTHIEIEATPRTPLPVTTTGYRSRFVDPAALEDHADVGAFVLAWMDEAAADWDGQMSLF